LYKNAGAFEIPEPLRKKTQEIIHIKRPTWQKKSIRPIQERQPTASEFVVHSFVPYKKRSRLNWPFAPFENQPFIGNDPDS